MRVAAARDEGARAPTPSPWLQSRKGEQVRSGLTWATNPRSLCHRTKVGTDGSGR